MDSGWEFDKFDDGSLKAAETNQLKKYGEFLSTFAHDLKEITEPTFKGHLFYDWDCSLDAIALKYAPVELNGLINLVTTDNKIFNKIMVTLAACCCELQFLKHEAETKFIPAILYYGEGVPDECYKDGKIPLQLGRFLPMVQNVLCFVNRCNETIKHTIQQLSCLYAKSQDGQKLFDVNDVHFLVVFQHIGHALTVLITLDELLSRDSALSEDWEFYKRLLTSVKHDPTKYDFSIDAVKPFEKLLMTMEGKLLDGRIFQACAEQSFEDHKNNVYVRTHNMLADYSMAAMKSIFSDIEARLTASEAVVTNEKHLFVGLCGLLAMHFNVFGNIDKKFFKDVFSFNSKLPAVILCGSIAWQPAKFLKQRLPNLIPQLDKKTMARADTRLPPYLEEKTAALPKDVEQLVAKAAVWIVKMEGDFKRGVDLGGDLQAKCALLIEGIAIAFRINHLCRLVLCLHSELKRPLTKSLVLSLCRGIELCKSIETQFYRRSVLVIESVTQILQHLVSSTSQTIELSKRRIVAQSEKRYSERHLDILSALLLAQQMLSGPCTRERRLLTRLALSVGSHMGAMREEETTTVNTLLLRIDYLADLCENIRTGCDCSFFYWHRDSVFKLYLDDLFKNTDGVQRLQLMLFALEDPIRGMLATRHKDSPGEVVKDYQLEIIDTLKENLLNPLCNTVETDLRLQVHSHLIKRGSAISILSSGGSSSSAAGGGDPSEPHSLQMDLAHFFKVKPLRWCDKIVHIKGYVEHYLERTFYNLTTIALPDWRTYGEMKKLAQQKYQLSMGELHLPSQTLEQGTDVLQIMRGMSEFSASYHYNLNTQVFIEKKSDNKHLNTVNIRHVANSIRTHGLGIMNTTVNNTYLFLKGKLYQFSEFLFDERVKGKILKEWHEYKDKHLEQEQMFPFHLADRLKRNMRNLHVYPDGTDPLERFRNHITRIGNAMGFVRLIRSGCLNCCSNAISFIPADEDVDTNFEELISKAGLSENTVHSARNLDQVIENLTKNFAKETDYFKLFVEVFAVELRSKKNIHCRNFFILLTALSLNYVEGIIVSKDRLNKKNKESATFTDDGFAIGVAFLLKVLDLYKEFDSLQWFTSISEHYRKEKESVNQQLNTGKLEEKLRQTHTLTLRRLDQWETEFKLLSYSLTSARVFFRADQTADEAASE